MLASTLGLLAAGVALGASSAPALAACQGETMSVRSGNLDTVRTAVTCLVNEARTARGLQPLNVDAKLQAAAQSHADDMRARNYFAHDTLLGPSFADRITASGYRWSSIGENIAQGQLTAYDVVQGWLASGGHCANILGAFNDIGIGVNAGAYWVQDFGVARGAQANARGGSCPTSLGRDAGEPSTSPSPSTGTTPSKGTTPSTGGAPSSGTTPAPATGTTQGTKTAPGRPKVIRTKGVSSPRRGLRVTVTCVPADAGCTGLLRLRAGRGGRIVGSLRFSVASGRTRTVLVRLSRQGEALLRRTARRTVDLELVSGADARSVRALRLAGPRG